MAGTVGVQVTPYQILASGSPTSYSAVGLPAGLALNPVTGEITGTPTTVTPVSGSIVQIVASNGGGDGSANLIVTIAKGSSSVTVTGSTSFTFNGSPQGPATANVSGSTGVVTYSYSGFESTTYGPLATPPTNAGSYVVTASVVADATYNGASSSATSFTITKDTPIITAAPTASAITEGQSLNASLLSGGTASVAGAFSWTTPSTVPTVGAASYEVTFTPTDTANYNTATTTISVTVNPAEQLGTTYSGWLNGAGASDAAFLDYVFGAVTPGTLDASLKPTVMVTGGNLVLTYYVRQGTVGLTVTPKTSDDLAAGPSGWVTTDVTVADVGTPRPVNGVNVQQKTASVPVSGAKKFLRVEAVQQ